MNERHIKYKQESTCIVQSNRKCDLCNLNDIEDKFHFIHLSQYFEGNAVVHNYAFFPPF